MGLRSEDVAAVGRRVAAYHDDALSRLPSPSADARLAALYRREAEAALRRPRAPFSWRLGVALAACAALISLFVLSRSREPLTYQLAGTAGAVGRWVAADASPIVLDFSDGSRIDVALGGRARVTALASQGAGVLLERGSLHVRVVPHHDNHWVVMGGPFEVHVVGTEFDVGWNAQAEELTVAMLSGRVRVEGPCVDPSGRLLSAPASMRISCVSSPSASTASVVEPRPSLRASAVAAAPDASAPLPAAESRAETWRARLAAGRLDDAFAEVESLGVDVVIERAHATELVDLGSAARLAHKPGTAVRFYEAARRRFPGSDAAASSAYHLGRMTFDGRGAWDEAARWFAAYLAEQPRGRLAPEALGRSMECAAKLGDYARARELAARYLAAYPKGAHAALATALVGEAH
ncbi:Hypothetical protein A7982_04362 [Minicystis rosea]|nr:Hypothetical protein A7982_04362 [Minicystis rosea]